MSGTSDITRRIGRFSLRGDLVLDHPERAIQALSGMIILRAEHMWATDRFEYTALSAAFDVVPDGCQPFDYEALCTETPEGVTISWVRRSPSEALIEEAK
jgi:hypothetical protein